MKKQVRGLQHGDRIMVKGEEWVVDQVFLPLRSGWNSDRTRMTLRLRKPSPELWIEKAQGTLVEVIA